MRLAYAFSPHHRNVAVAGTGSSVHIQQFIANTLALGHKIWTWPANQQPGTYTLPTNRLARILALRQMDVLYFRVDFTAPSSSRWTLAPYRQLLGSPLIVWEINGVPEFGRVIGQSEEETQRHLQNLRYFGQGCHLAICVSHKMADYVREKIGLVQVLVVPNGSDPELFRPDVSPVKRIQPKPEQLNVVWMGSGGLSWNRFDLLCQAAQLLWERDQASAIVFHIIGQIPVGLMRNMSPNVHYYGFEDYNTLPNWLAAMDVGLCLYYPGPADYGSPLKLFDYMASGLTVISTPQPQVIEIFEQLEQPELVVSADDPNALADLLQSLALNREKVRRQGQKSRQLVLDFYNWRRATQITLHEIERLLQERDIK